MKTAQFLQRMYNHVYRYTFSDSIDTACDQYKFQKISLLRSFCQRVGIQILLREYNFDNKQRQPFYEDDIINMYPIVKHVAPKVPTPTPTRCFSRSMLASSRQLWCGQNIEIFYANRKFFLSCTFATNFVF